MTGRLTELLFANARPELGWQVLRRMARWVERFPYFPQTIYGDDLRLQPHERNWFLQVSAGAGAQAVVHGVFGINSRDNGTLSIEPHYNASMISPTASLSNYRFRGAVFSVEYNCSDPVAFWGSGVTRDGSAVLVTQQRPRVAVECRTTGTCDLVS